MPSANIWNRPSRDDRASKPREDLTPIGTEVSKPAKNTSDNDFRLSNQAPLTATRLEDLGTQLKKDDNSVLKHSDAWASSSVKKRAIGHGHSPSSSIRTTYSNDSKRLLSKGASSKHISSSKPQVTPPIKARDLDESDIARPPTTGKRLFEPDSDSPFTAQPPLASNASQRPKSVAQNPQHRRNQKSGQYAGQVSSQRPLSGAEPGLFSASVLVGNAANEQETPPLEPPKIVRQPETRPISQEQLVAEVKGIYAGLVMVEGKCIQVDAKQVALAREVPAGTQPKLNNEQWQALIALHRTLLHEHHDFFLASQHPSATPAVRRLAIKYAMPARLWRHGIHSFLELLRNRLPDSLDHMLAFIYLAYSMMTLLFETVPAFEETWIECLGDLGRYRMAIEDDDIRDREVWTQVSRQWYLKASDRAPRIGRLYHHLAILARPNALQQLFFYGKALSVSQPFPAAKDSILTLFEPILSGKQTRRLPPVITAYVKIHALIFMRNDPESFYEGLAEFISLLDGHISRVTQRFLEQGYYMGISNCFALLSYGSPDGLLSKVLSLPNLEHMASTNMTGKDYTGSPTETILFREALHLFVQTLEINCKRIGDPNVLSFLHVSLVFVVYVSQFPAAMRFLENDIHWEPLVSMLNTLLRFYHFHSRIEEDKLPIPEKNDFRPTPEEFAMRGLEWAASYFPPDWFENKNIEEENQYKEDACMNTDYRPERILWLGCRLAKSGKWFAYNNKDHKFFIPGLVEMGNSSMAPAVSSDLELDSGTESSTDTATIMADSDADELLSFASRTSTGLSEKTQGEESNWRDQNVSTWESQEVGPDDRMDIAEEPPQPP